MPVVALRGTVARAAARRQQQVVPLLVVPVDVAVQLLNLNKSRVACNFTPPSYSQLFPEFLKLDLIPADFFSRSFISRVIP